MSRLLWPAKLERVPVISFCSFVAGSTTSKVLQMGQSQNFLLYIRNVIKMKVTEWINNLKKYVNPSPLWGYIQHVQIITI